MNRYLSTVSLYIRSNLWRVLAAALAAALLCGILVYCYPSGEYTDSAGVDPATGQEMLYTSQYPTLDGVVKASGAPIADTSLPVVTMSWQYVAQTIFNMLILVALIKGAERIAKEMFGL